MVLSLVYEGIDVEFIHSALPLLADLGWRATFFANPTVVLDSLAEWRQLADFGHEVGNGALSGVTLTGALTNWTARMVEQDLHMTQTFLDDTFGARAVSAFAYPGPLCTCADGDYRGTVDEMFDMAVGPDGVAGDCGTSLSYTGLFEWDESTPWTVIRAPLPGSIEMEELRFEVKARGYQVLPLYEAGVSLGRLTGV